MCLLFLGGLCVPLPAPHLPSSWQWVPSKFLSTLDASLFHSKVHFVVDLSSVLPLILANTTQLYVWNRQLSPFTLTNPPFLTLYLSPHFFWRLASQVDLSLPNGNDKHAGTTGQAVSKIITGSSSNHGLSRCSSWTVSGRQ
ncbi:hypothetical protein B0H63DRAFT_99171 [Podospora didyma]|uniref:Uncharacterized protein n=1 Tax=Podospora didyma TaxID=330526 RepID=A0AAE0U3G7_9PEZI|nr:hypothetical protein B0H63DRAFT_99171 [Podospora didyma]